jgi:flagellar hook-length control protein FliK
MATIVPNAAPTPTAKATSASNSASSGASGKSQQASGASAKTQQASNADGKTAGKSDSEGTFTQVLSGQMKQDSSAVATDEPTDTALTLAGLLQMLQSLTVPVQNVVQNQGEVSVPDSKDQGLPDMLLTAMNSNSNLTDSLLQNPNVQQWFQQAQEILSALTGKGATASKPLTALQTSDKGSQNLQAQNTLLSLSSLMKEQPNNVILQHVVQDLQKVMEPVLPLLVQNLQIDATPVNATKDSIVEPEAVGNDSNGLMGQAVNKSASTHDKHATIKKQKVAEVEANIVPTVTPAMSKLEVLAAKNAVHMPLLAATNALETEPEFVPELIVDSTTTESPVVQFGDMLKMPALTGSLEKADPQTLSSDNFTQEMTEHVLKNMKITLADGISEAKLSLFPKNLGHVDVKITLHEGQLVAQFTADTVAGKQMLESQLPQLRQSLQSQGLQVEKLEVTQNQSMQSGMFQDQRNQQSSSQTFRQNQKGSASYEEDNTDFVQELSGATQSKSNVFGNSFDVTA